MLKISAVYLIGKAEIPIHYTSWGQVEQALLWPSQNILTLLHYLKQPGKTVLQYAGAETVLKPI